MSLNGIEKNRYLKEIFDVKDTTSIGHNAITRAKFVFSFSGPVLLLLADILPLFYEPLSFERIAGHSSLPFLFKELTLTLPILSSFHMPHNRSVLEQPSFFVSQMIDNELPGGTFTPFDYSCLLRTRRLLASATRSLSHTSQCVDFFPAYSYLRIVLNASSRENPATVVADFLQMLMCMQDFSTPFLIKPGLS
jgi:hypothetical protein